MGVDSYVCVTFGWKIRNINDILHLDGETDILEALRYHIEENICDTHPFFKIDDLELRVIHVPDGGYYKYNTYIGVSLSLGDTWIYEHTSIPISYLSKICNLQSRKEWNDLCDIISNINGDYEEPSLHILPFLS